MIIDFYGVRPRKDHRGVDPISDALPFGRLWYGEPNAINHAIGYATHSASHFPLKRIANDSAFVGPSLATDWIRQNKSVKYFHLHLVRC
jgi:hypothetical protein